MEQCLRSVNSTCSAVAIGLRSWSVDKSNATANW